MLGEIRRSGEYLEKIDIAGGICYVLSRHADLEMSRIELDVSARFVMRPHAYAHQSFYLLTGHLRSLEPGIDFRAGSSFKLETMEAVTLEARSPVALLYFSTYHDFETLTKVLR